MTLRMTEALTEALLRRWQVKLACLSSWMTGEIQILLSPFLFSSLSATGESFLSQTNSASASEGVSCLQVRETVSLSSE